jgi:hypothetical protein
LSAADYFASAFKKLIDSFEPALKLKAVKVVKKSSGFLSSSSVFEVIRAAFIFSSSSGI